ncbi:MAG: LLM class flavin-dependent oxidoreductase [Gammaproteobacteria bacterium]|nr:LLM class flavin-dependent oxidoreductase [Gammaproteobacteria bacterium]
MQFDLFYELSVPDHLQLSEKQVFDNTIEEIRLADNCDFTTAWLVEHHFMKQYSHSSAPELYLAALSQQTQRIRLGHAIIPLPYNHPVRTAERLATLDILCNGRLEFGFGRGFSPKEYQNFGVSMKDSRTVTQESFEIIKASFSGEAFSYEGQHFQIDDIEIVPKCLQQPHPPIWTAAVSPDSYELAAQLGIGALAGPFKPWFMIKEDIKLYHKAWEKYKDSHAANAQRKTGMTIGILCLDDKKRSNELGKQAFEWFYHQLLKQTLPVLKNLYESYEYYQKVGILSPLLDKTVNLSLLETLGLVIVGTPEHCVKKLKKMEKAGVDNVLLAIGGGAIDTNIVKESMQLINDEVIPHFK